MSTPADTRAAAGGPASERLWQVSWRAGISPLLVVLLLAIVIGAAELALRVPAVTGRLLPPGRDIPSRHAEQQIARLEAFAAVHDRLDCVFIGSSLVLTGFDPAAFSTAFAAAGGRPLACFNLGIPGITASDAAALVEWVTREYRPWLVVYGTTYRDFSAGEQGPQLAARPWIEYRRGAFSIDGWLTEHSAAYRYFLTYRHVLDGEQWRWTHNLLDNHADGYWPRARTAVDLPGQIAANRDLLIEHRSDPDDRQLAAVEVFAAAAAAGTQVVAIEMPGPRALSAWLTDTPNYQRFSGPIRAAWERAGITYWETWKTVPSDLIADDGWLDLLHINTTGAARLSAWLGGQLAAAVARGELRAPPPT